MTLKEYLEIYDETPLQFAKRTLICYNTVVRILKGLGVKPVIAKKVRRATKKEVGMEDIVLWKAPHPKIDDCH